MLKSTTLAVLSPMVEGPGEVGVRLRLPISFYVNTFSTFPSLSYTFLQLLSYVSPFIHLLLSSLSAFLLQYMSLVFPTCSN